MNRHLSSALAIGATAALAFAVAALSPNPAYADDITIDPTPFVSTRTRAEVKSELMSQRREVMAGASEWALQQNGAAHATSDYTRAQARADFLASRREVSAFNGEDSGSAYLARMAKRPGGEVIVAGSITR